MFISQINSISFYIGPRIGLDMSTITLKGKLNDTIKEIKNVIIAEKNTGKLSSRFVMGLSLESFFSAGMLSAGFCIDASRSFRKKNTIETQQSTLKYMINSSSWTLGVMGAAGLNFSLFRLLFFVGPHGQYMESTDDSKNTKHKEWQWIPMIGIGPQIRLGVMVLEVRYLHPAQINLFKQGSNTIKNRVTFNKKGMGTLSVSALMRV